MTNLMMLENLEQDKRKRAYVTPVKVVWMTQEEDAMVENSRYLLEHRSPQISLQAKNPCILHNRGKTASVLLDFGREIHGGIVIAAWQETKGDGVCVRVRFGESAMEAMSETGEGKTATNDHALRDLTIMIHSMSMTPVGETGFRFVRLDLLEKNASLVLKTVKGVLVYRDIPYRGSFRSSDALLNRIWDTGAYTVHLNMQNYLWDGIKRDRLIWAGDMHPEIAAIEAVFGFDETVPKSLDFVRDETPLPGWMNGFPAYSMWWVISQYDWYWHTGDLAYLREQREYLMGLAEQLFACIGEDGRDTTPQVRFVDWPTSENADAVDAGLQAIHILAEEKMEILFQALREPQWAKRCRENAARLRRWKGNCGGAKQAAALMVLAGQEDAKEVNQRLLRVGGAQGLSAFMGYYILTARAMAGDILGCLDCVREYWGGMLALGATTFWEDFDIRWMEGASPIDALVLEEDKGDGRSGVDVHGTYGNYCYQGYRHSLCHGWSAGVTPWISETILGVRVMDAGCRRLEIWPRLGDLEWAEGTYPTPHGEVYIFHSKKKDGTIESVIRAPGEIETVLVSKGEKE